MGYGRTVSFRDKNAIGVSQDDLQEYEAITIMIIMTMMMPDAIVPYCLCSVCMRWLSEVVGNLLQVDRNFLKVVRKLSETF